MTPNKEIEKNSEEIAEETDKEIDDVDKEETEGKSPSEDSLQTKVDELQQQVEELNDRFLRLNAEYDNYRKRTTQEKASIYPEATAKTVASFLPILDNFERAQEYEPETKEFREGFELIYQNLLEVMDSLGVEVIGERGEPFDPEFHNAVMHCDDKELGSNCVAMVLQKGYKIGDRVIRHAVVQTANSD